MQQIDLGTSMRLQQVSRLSDGDYEQSMVVQHFLDCVDRATASSTAFVSFRERPMHCKDNQTLNLQVVDPWQMQLYTMGVIVTVKSGDKTLKRR